MGSRSDHRSEEDLIEVVGAIYEAGLEGCWEPALARVTSYVGAERGMLGFTDVASETADVFTTYCVDTELLARWYSDYGQEDPWAAGGSVLVEGEIARGCDLVPLEELRRKRVYVDLAEPGGMHDVIVSIVVRRDPRFGWVNVYQGPEKGFFSTAAVERMARLAPHIQRAARIHTRFAELEGRVRADAAALDALSAAVLTCDAGGRVLSANRGAEDLLREGGALTVRAGRLRCRTSNESSRLRAMVKDAAETSIGRGARGGSAMALPRGPGERPLSVLVAPVSQRLERGLAETQGARPAAVVLIGDPERRLDLPEELLAELFGLTPSESRLARALAEGGSLSDYARDAGIQTDTARWHLKRVQAKTDTRRQAELVSLLLRTLPLAQR